MKLFEFDEDLTLARPKELAAIKEYLNRFGTLNVKSDAALEKLYREYCDEAWAARWMTLNADILNGFAYWLAEKEL